VTGGEAIIEIDVAPEFKTSVDRDLVEAAVRQTLVTVEELDPEGAGLLQDRPGHISVRLNGDDEMQELNRTYRRIDRPTDVLSFAFTEAELVSLPPDVPLQLGEVAVDFDFARRQAAELEHSLDMEVSWLVIHGTLQLLGYGHGTEAEAEHMERLETQALRALGFRKG
jgi:probable rRNA maturation factor